MIRNFIQEDKEILLSFAEEFYNSPAVSHPIPVKNFENCFNEILDGSPYVKGLTILKDEKIAGYCQLSLTYSSEADGLVVLIEEIYISKDFQKQGLSQELFEYLYKEFPLAKRFRLECCEDNINALKVYKRQGFEVLDYIQMIKE